MITKEDISITSTYPFFNDAVYNSGNTYKIFFKIDVEFVLFNIFKCEATCYNELKTLEEIEDFIIETFNSKLKNK